MRCAYGGRGFFLVALLCTCIVHTVCSCLLLCPRPCTFPFLLPFFMHYAYILFLFRYPRPGTFPCAVIISSSATYALARSHAPFFYSCAVLIFFPLPRPHTIPCPFSLFMRCEGYPFFLLPASWHVAPFSVWCKHFSFYCSRFCMFPGPILSSCAFNLFSFDCPRPFTFPCYFFLFMRYAFLSFHCHVPRLLFPITCRMYSTSFSYPHLFMFPCPFLCSCASVLTEAA